MTFFLSEKSDREPAIRKGESARRSQLLLTISIPLTLSFRRPTPTVTRMAQRDPTEIPQELIDQVIDLCSADKKTLKACSLISRAWVYRTRKHLFSTLKLTSDSLVTWCEVIAAPTPETEHPVPRTTSRPPASSSYGFSWLSSYVISLKLIPAYSPVHIKAALLRVNAHLSAFINLKTLTLYAIRIHSFEEASLRVCFGPFAKTVRELKIWMCFPGLELSRILESVHPPRIIGTRWELMGSQQLCWTAPRFARGPTNVTRFILCFGFRQH